MTNRPLGLLFLLLLSSLSVTHAEEAPADIVRSILQSPSAGGDRIKSPHQVLICWSDPDHPVGTHGYQQFSTSMSALLSRVDNIKAQSVKGFPSTEQWASADLVIFFLTQKALSEAQCQQLDSYLKRGGAIIVLHQGLVLRNNYNEWADRVGFAYSWAKGPENSKWGNYENPVTIDNTSEILAGFPRQITFKDELYWNMRKGTRGKITVLAETTAPGAKGAEAEKKWPVYWTVEHPSDTPPAAASSVPSSAISTMSAIHRSTASPSSAASPGASTSRSGLQANRRSGRPVTTRHDRMAATIPPTPPGSDIPC